ncbi:hypothetical protein LTR10_014940 [Elasticomyces elasticus]|nr:hypothetical protein LTR10_014940 [Elasticomyces elasticus]KAK4964518.1 hypothetical protein LTR42_012814 [Elasticomyces elasticus]
MNGTNQCGIFRRNTNQSRRLQYELQLSVADEETPAVTDQKAEKKAAKNERKSEIEALLKAGGQPEIRNGSDRKLWEKVKAKGEPVVNDDEEEEEKEEDLVGLGDDDSGFADYGFNELSSPSR